LEIAGGLKCVYCDEPILAGEPARQIINGSLHEECLVRATLGSAAHQSGLCGCYGGSGEDPPEATRREGARLAFEVFRDRAKKALAARFN
jgi:hypothetical protein